MLLIGHDVPRDVDQKERIIPFHKERWQRDDKNLLFLDGLWQEPECESVDIEHTIVN
ncbi:hypothetical protein DC3_47400 [Deinococcus cellulosilyticus NBRC 106333 = KACC 11606]|uniref:Uncharacterized protein n=1 Tax=Deinococcus cellulosilyticus (strain DSM 18568 / NBRC 106333 / KACC 11606 / 5516J-15) TaxID=1223518 RepID=A0A511N8E6_DEIC1|nr:hypothetical protein DC3_47400 [Deinococcus cellulosilyticus NBRC 106333 = KACC 11606]